MKTVLLIISFLLATELLLLAARMLFKKEFRNPLYITFGINSLLTAVWIVGYAIMYITADKETALFAYRITSIGWTVGLGTWVLFFYELYNLSLEKPNRVLLHILIFAAGGFFWLLALNGKIYASDLTYSVWWGWEEIVDKSSIWVLAFDLFLMVLVILSFIKIVNTLKNSKGKKHSRQIKLIGITFISVTIPAVVINLALPLLNIKDVPPLGSFFMGVVSLSIGYVIMKYRVLDIDPISAASQIFLEISDYVFLTDLNGKIKRVNSSTLFILSYELDEILNKSIFDIIQGFDLHELESRGVSSRPAFKTEMTAAKGVRIPVRCKVTIVKDNFQDPMGYLLVMSDLRDMIAIEDLENAVKARTFELEEKNKKLQQEITERKRAEETIQNIEKRQRAMISNISDVIAILDKEGTILYNSPNLAALFGWETDKIIGRSGFEIIHPDDLDYVRTVFDELISKPNEKRTLEFRYRCGNGNYKVVNTTVLNKLTDPLINGVLLNYHDITERYYAEQEKQSRINKKQSQQEALLQITNDPIFKTGNADEAFRLITETSAQVLDVEKVSIWLYTGNNTLQECVDLYEKSTGKHFTLPPVKTTNFPQYTKDIGTGFVISINDVMQDKRTAEFREAGMIWDGVTSLMDAGIRMSGKPIGVLGFSHVGEKREWNDYEISFASQLSELVTQVLLYRDRIVMEEKLRLFAYTIRSVSENVSITNMQDEIIFVNKAFCKTYGYEESELLGKHVSIFRTGQSSYEGARNILQSTIMGGWEGELWNKRKDGTEFLIYLSTSVIKDEAGEPVALVGIATDITEKKEKEQKLFNLLTFQSEMLETAAIWINTLDVNSNVTFWNRAAEQISGYSREEVLYKNSIFEYLYPDPVYRAGISSEVSDIIHQGKRVEDFQTTIITKSGDEKIISWNSNNLVDEKGNLIGSIAIGVDITEKNKAVQQLRESEEKFRILLDESTDPIFSFAPDGTYLYVNRAFTLGVGKNVEDVVGKRIWDVFPKEEADKRYVAVKHVFSTGEEKKIEVRVPRSDGDRYYITSITPIKSTDGKVISVICSSKEISERKKMEDALRLSEQKLRLHFEQTPLGVIEFNKELKIVSWNKASEQIFGYTSDEAIGKSAVSLVPKTLELFVDKMLLSLIEEKSTAKGVNENVRKDGQVILCEWYNTALTDSSGEIIGIASLVMDITARKESELEQTRLMEELKSSQVHIEEEAVKLALLNEQLLDSESKLKELNASKDKFFSIIAHDLKSPFLSLLGYSEILLNDYDELSDDEKRESIQSIYQLSNNSYRLLENLLQWSRIQIGKIEFSPEPFNLFYELAPALLLLTQTAKNKNITIQNNINRKLFITADKNMLNTIIRNLVSNAVKFTNKGGVVTLSAAEDMGNVKISVKDNGIGMEKEQVDNLFSIDKTVSTTGTASETGTGLGLLLCKEMIDKHGGTISVKSTLGIGTEFIFTIPINEE